MLFGLVAYVVYRRYVEGTSLTRRVTVPELALKKQSEEPRFTSILVPVFGTKLDDDIVSTAGRIAQSEVSEGELNAKLEVIFVPETPLTVPLNAPLPPRSATSPTEPWRGPPTSGTSTRTSTSRPRWSRRATPAPASSRRPAAAARR